MLINWFLETQNSWGWCHGAGKQLCAGLREPQSFVQREQLLGVQLHCGESAARRTSGLTSKPGTCFWKPLSARSVGSGQSEAPRCQL